MVFKIQNPKKDSFDLSHGFLAKKDPITSLPKAFDDWENVASVLPKVLANNQMPAIIEILPKFPLKNLKTDAAYERAMLILSYIAHAYVWSQEKPDGILPAKIAMPWYAVAKKLGRPPILSYASYALYNWYRLNPDEPIEIGNIALLQNFLGGVDEEWFILIHVEIEAKAAQAMNLLQPAQKAVEDHNVKKLNDCLCEIAGVLKSLCECLDRMPEQCDPYVYYRRVRPYIHGWKDNPALPKGMIYKGVRAYKGKPQKFKGETGAQSSIIPSLDAALGIKHANNPLKKHLTEMREYMPPDHRAFIAHLEKGPSIRKFVEDNYRRHPELRASYNDCVRYIGRFRMTHLKYAAKYIEKQSRSSVGNPTAVGTGGTPFMAYLAKHQQETELYLI